MKRLYYWIFPFCVLIGIWCTGCEEERNIPVNVLTEEVFFTSSEKARVLARIISSQGIRATDHGFQVDSDENYNNPLTVSLGPKEGIGSFFAEIEGLDIGSPYFVRAYLQLDNELILGNSIPFETLNPELISFTPRSGIQGNQMVILGRNFTSDTQVFFGDREANITNLEFESRITLRVPAVGNEQFETIRVVSGTRELIFEEKFEYFIGNYQRIGGFPASVHLQENLYFQSGGRFFTGLGMGRDFFLNDKIWRYDLNVGEWTEVPFPGTFHRDPFFSQTYFGSGIQQVSQGQTILTNEFWFFDGNQFVSLPNTPFQTVNSVAFRLANSIYVVGGAGDAARKIRTYQINSGSWSSLQDAPYAIDKSLANFSHGGKHYFILQSKSLVAYDPLTQNWSTVGVYPGSNTQGFGFGLTIGNKAYVGLYRRSAEMWELDLDSFSWRRKIDFTGNLFAFNAGIYNMGGEIYILRSYENSVPNQPTMDFWKFDPNGF